MLFSGLSVLFSTQLNMPQGAASKVPICGFIEVSRRLERRNLTEVRSRRGLSALDHMLCGKSA